MAGGPGEMDFRSSQAHGFVCEDAADSPATTGDIMSIILQDAVHLETPTRSPVRPAAPLDPESVSGRRKVSVELESPGGHRRTVTGTIAYFDDEA